MKKVDILCDHFAHPQGLLVDSVSGTKARS